MAALCREFEPVAHEATLLNQLRALQQTGSLNDYTAAFQNLLLQLPPFPESFLLSSYLYGMRHSLRVMVGQQEHGS